MSKIPQETFEVAGLTIVCDKPLASVGFLYFSINGDDAGRIVFNRKDFETFSGGFEFHFNQTGLFIDEKDSLKRQKMIVREAICKRFHATDKTFDLRQVNQK